MEKIGEIIKRVISIQEPIETRNIDDIDAVWYRVVDGNIGQHSYVLKVEGNILVVRVDNRCYITEIKRREKEIISRLHQFGWHNIKTIRFRIG